MLATKNKRTVRKNRRTGFRKSSFSDTIPPVRAGFPGEQGVDRSPGDQKGQEAAEEGGEAIEQKNGFGMPVTDQETDDDGSCDRAGMVCPLGEAHDLREAGFSRQSHRHGGKDRYHHGGRYADQSLGEKDPEKGRLPRKSQAPQSEEDRCDEKGEPFFGETVGDHSAQRLGKKKGQIPECQRFADAYRSPVEVVGELYREERHDAGLDVTDQKIDPEIRQPAGKRGSPRLPESFRKGCGHFRHPEPGKREARPAGRSSLAGSVKR